MQVSRGGGGGNQELMGEGRVEVQIRFLALKVVGRGRGLSIHSLGIFSSHMADRCTALRKDWL